MKTLATKLAKICLDLIGIQKDVRIVLAVTQQKTIPFYVKMGKPRSFRNKFRPTEGIASKSA